MYIISSEQVNTKHALLWGNLKYTTTKCTERCKFTLRLKLHFFVDVGFKTKQVLLIYRLKFRP